MESDRKKSFGEFISQRRRALGMTQREFADRLFVTDSAVSKWEQGMSYPDITLLRDICEVLGVSEHELLTASEDVEARTAERLAARYRRMANTYRLAQYALYGGAALICLVCDLSAGGGLDWSLVVLASLLCAASLTLAPALAPEKRGGVCAALCFTGSLLLLYGVICLVYGYGWFAVAALGSLLGLWFTLGPYLLRRLPLPESLSRRKAALWLGVCLALLLALLGVCCLRGGGDWFITAALGVLLGAAALLLPLVIRQLPLPRELEGHRALLWLAVCTLLLAALIPAAGAGNLLHEAYPFMLIGMSLPWLLLLCLRYLPLSRYFRASAACAVSGLWLWLAPYGVQLVLWANGEDMIQPYDPLHPYNVDFSDWVSAPTLGGNILITILLALGLSAVILAALGLRQKLKTRSNKRRVLYAHGAYGLIILLHAHRRCGVGEYEAGHFQSVRPG